ncbi:MAG: DUF559 domain-containing protein [Gammaproteobacteria bacterium]|nr:DUF559 domain-containing protein [Gammaproteobacteria bacterium]
MTAIQVAYDDQRTKFLRSFGYTVLRFGIMKY